MSNVLDLSLALELCQISSAQAVDMIVAQGSSPSTPGRRNPGQTRGLLTVTLVCGLVNASSSSTARAQGANAVPVPARPQSAGPAQMRAEGRAFYEQGLARYAARDFVGAVAAFESGYGIDPAREFLFAEAQAFRLQGDCGRALPLYHRFLATDPPAIQVEATRLGLDRCAQRQTQARPRPRVAAVASSSTSSSTSPAPPAGTDVVVKPLAMSPGAVTPARGMRAFLRDPVVLASLASGLAALGAGVSFWVAAAEARTNAESDNVKTYDDFARDWHLVERRHAIAVVALSTGAALLVLTAGRVYSISRRRPAVEARSSALGFDGKVVFWSLGY